VLWFNPSHDHEVHAECNPFHFYFFIVVFNGSSMALIIYNITHSYMFRSLEWKWIWWILWLVELRCNALRNVGGFNSSFFRKVLEATFAQHTGIAKCPGVVYFSNLKIQFESIFAIL
jgi:hypothetical protein